MASSIRSKMRCVLRGLMYETESKHVNKSKRCVLFMTFRPSQRTLFMARRNWVPLALKTDNTWHGGELYRVNRTNALRALQQS